MTSENHTGPTRVTVNSYEDFLQEELRDRELAAECTQDTFVSAWRSRDRFAAELGSLAGWLLGIARYRVIDTQRRSGKLADVALH